jgi:hypothetical protein
MFLLSSRIEIIILEPHNLGSDVTLGRIYNNEKSARIQ